MINCDSCLVCVLIKNSQRNFQNIRAKKIVLHPNYYGGGLYYDVALVFLAQSATLAPHIDTICLPKGTPNYDINSCWAAGWGLNQFGMAFILAIILISPKN